MTDAKIIPLFGDAVPRKKRIRKRHIEEEEGVGDLLSETLKESIADVQDGIEQLFTADTVEEFISGVRRIKGEVRKWPSRG